MYLMLTAVESFTSGVPSQSVDNSGSLDDKLFLPVLHCANRSIELCHMGCHQREHLEGFTSSLQDLRGVCLTATTFKSGQILWDVNLYSYVSTSLFCSEKLHKIAFWPFGFTSEVDN